MIIRIPVSFSLDDKDIIGALDYCKTDDGKATGLFTWIRPPNSNDQGEGRCDCTDANNIAKYKGAVGISFDSL